MQQIPKSSPGFMGKYIWVTDTIANGITPIATDSYQSYQSNKLLWLDYLPRLHSDAVISGDARLVNIPKCSVVQNKVTYPCRHDPKERDCSTLSTNAEEACGIVFALAAYNSYVGYAARNQMECFQFTRITLIFLNDDETLIHSLRSASSVGVDKKVVSVIARYPSVLLGGGETPRKDWMPIDVPTFDVKGKY